MCAVLYVWKSEDDLQELAIFYHVSCRDWTQVFGCGSKHLSFPAEPPHWLYSEIFRKSFCWSTLKRITHGYDVLMMEKVLRFLPQQSEPMNNYTQDEVVSDFFFLPYGVHDLYKYRDGYKQKR